MASRVRVSGPALGRMGYKGHEAVSCTAACMVKSIERQQQERHHRAGQPRARQLAALCPAPRLAAGG